LFRTWLSLEPAPFKLQNGRGIKRIVRLLWELDQKEFSWVDGTTITLNRTISQFAYMKRPQSQIRQTRLNWNVKPPKDPFF